MKDILQNQDTGEYIKFNEASQAWEPYSPQYLETLTNEDTGERIGLNEVTNTWEPLPVDFEGNEFTRGVKRGVSQLDSLVTEGGKALAKGLANEVLDRAQAVSDFYNGPQVPSYRFNPKENLKKYLQETEYAANRYPTSTPSYKDILAQDTLSDALSSAGDYLASSAGEAVPSIAASMVGGGAGGYVAKKSAEKVASGLALEEARKYIADQSLKGAARAAITVEFGQTAPGAYVNLLEQGSDSPLEAIGVGAAQAAVGSLMETRLLSKMIGEDLAQETVRRGLLKHAGRETAISAATEGLAEGVQEGLDIFAENILLDKDIYTPENIERVLESTLKGSIGGGMTGAVLSPVTRGQGPARKLTKEEADSIYEEVDMGPSNISDTAAIKPAYTTTEQDKALDALGVDAESALQVSPEDLQTTLGKTVEAPTTPALAPEQKAKLDKGLDERQKAKKDKLSGKTEVTTDVQFQPGDGVIEKGNKPVPVSSTVPPARKLRTVNPRALERATAEAALKAKKRNPNRLPRDLQSAKVNMGQTRLKFSSDVEKALYIARPKSKGKSKRDGAYREWLKSVHGMTDADIDTHSESLHKAVKEIHNADSTAESIDVPALFETDTGPKLQRLPNLPFRGNFQDDAIVPQQLADNLYGQQLSPEALRSNANIIKNIKRIAKEVGSPNLQVKFFSNLSVDPNMSSDPVSAAYWNNNIYVALRDHTMTQAQIESAYHEVAHFLWENGGFSQSDKEFMINEAPTLRKYMDKDGYLSDSDFDRLMSTQSGREELVCNAIGKMAASIDQTGQPKGVFATASSRIRNFINRLRNSLRGQGFRTFDDIIKNMVDGKNAVSAVNDSNYTNKAARLQRIADETVQAEIAKQEADLDDLAKEAVEDANKSTAETGTRMGNWGRYFKSIGHLARKNPVAALAYGLTSLYQQNTAALLNSYSQLLGGYTNLPKEMRYQIAEIADFTSLTDQKATLTEEGFLTYNRDGRKVVIKNKEFAENYMNLQKAFGKVLTDWLSSMADTILNRHKEYFTKPAIEKASNLTIEDVNSALQNAKVAEDVRAIESLENLQEMYSDVARMQSKDFFPKMRFGSYGFAVHDMEGNQVAFYTMERGDFMGGLYNKYQYTNAIKQIKEKYGDSSKYRVIGDKTITNLDGEPRPFVLTHSSLKNHVNTQYLNLESVAGLLYSKDMDPENYKSVRDALVEEIQQRGFKNRFSESKNIDGYSRDMDRVIHAYFSGAARFIPNNQYQQQKAALMGAMEGLDDKEGPTSLKSKIDKYLDYTGSPQEDLQAIRTMNFIWTMGGNLSTAALQAITLPTFTLGVISQYNPNIIQNMAAIGRWVRIGSSMMMASEMDVSLTDGQIAMNMGDAERLMAFAKKHGLRPEHVLFLNKLNNYGTLRGGMTEENLGHKNFETRSMPGDVKSKMQTVGRVLGAPIGIMEQLTRFSTIMAAFDVYLNSPQAVAKAKEILANDHRYQAQVRNNPQLSDAENLAMYTMDEAHGVFGKTGRVEYQRGVGGAIFFPFMTYPHQMLETVATMMGRGADGRRGLAITATSLFLLAGLMGLPGAELLKELTEELIRITTGVDTDIDLVLREQIAKSTGSKDFALFVTQGIGRPLLGLDISKRIGLPAPGQEIILNLLGIKGESSDLLGVQGSIISGVADAVNSAMTGDVGLNMFSSITPVAAANVLKAGSFGTEGINTQRGDKLVRPEDVTTATKIARALGVSSHQVALAREKAYSKMLEEGKFKTGLDRMRKEGKKLATDMMKYREWGDMDKAKEASDALDEIRRDYIDFALKNGFPPDLQSFNRSIIQSAVDNRLDETRLKFVKKTARLSVKEREEILFGREKK